MQRMRKFWNSLSEDEKNQLGDELVFGSFDWRDWLENKPTERDLNMLDRMRIDWEIGGPYNDDNY